MLSKQIIADLGLVWLFTFFTAIILMSATKDNSPLNNAAVWLGLLCIPGTALVVFAYFLYLFSAGYLSIVVNNL